MTTERSMATRIGTISLLTQGLQSKHGEEGSHDESDGRDHSGRIAAEGNRRSEGIIAVGVSISRRRHGLSVALEDNTAVRVDGSYGRIQ